MKIKYAVFPGNVQSKTDGDKHFISAHRLMELYNVNPRECVIVDNHRKLMQYRSAFPKPVALHPRFDGDYTLPEPEHVTPYLKFSGELHVGTPTVEHKVFKPCDQGWTGQTDKQLIAYVSGLTGIPTEILTAPLSPEWLASCKEKKIMITKQEAKRAAEEKRDVKRKNGFAVYDVRSHVGYFCASWQDEMGRKTARNYNFAPPAKQYPKGTIGYVWNAVKNDTVIRKLISCDEGVYPYRCTGGGHVACWEHFEPIEQTSGLEKKAFELIAKEMCNNYLDCGDCPAHKNCPCPGALGMSSVIKDHYMSKAKKL